MALVPSRDVTFVLHSGQIRGACRVRRACCRTPRKPLAGVPVSLRLSDFKTNEYAHLVGGALFEPTEANPMIGRRRGSRYYHPDYRDGFVTHP